jgi:hypothetical protein
VIAPRVYVLQQQPPAKKASVCNTTDFSCAHILPISSFILNSDRQISFMGFGLKINLEKNGDASIIKILHCCQDVFPTPIVRF